MDLLVLQINGYPSDWDIALDGIPPGGGTGFVPGRLCEAGAPTSNGANVADGFRRFVYSFVEGGPDINYDREAIAVDELREILWEVESAVFRTMAGTPGGIEKLREAGADLTRSLLPEWLIDRVFGTPAGTPLVVRVDDIAACVPWELCYSSQYGTFLGTHLAVSRGVAVRISNRGRTTPRLHESLPVVLSEVSCVVNPEGDPAIASCAQALDDLAWDLAAGGSGAVFSVQAGVSKRKLLGALEKPGFHFTGHVHFDEDRGSYILCSDNLWMDAREATIALRRGVPPKLAILNGCRSDGAPRGEPEIERSATRASFVQQFYRNGALSVIGTRYEVDVGTAQALENHFFRAFADEPLPIGELMRRFRNSDARGWPCYVLYGDPRTRFVLAPDRPVPEPEPTRSHFQPQLRQDADPATCPSVSAAKNLPPQKLGIRKPGIRTPLYAVILVENSGYVVEYPDVLESIETFLSTATACTQRLNAELNPHGNALACGLRVIGYPVPLRGISDEFSQPAVDQHWSQGFVCTPRGAMNSTRLSMLLKGVLSDLKKLVGRASGLPLPAPVVIVCSASTPLVTARGGQRDAEDAIRICEDIRQLALPEVTSEPYYCETTAKTIALGFGDGVPESFLRGLAWGGTVGLWRRFYTAEEARRFADELFRSLLEPQGPEPLDGFADEFGNIGMDEDQTPILRPSASQNG